MSSIPFVEMSPSPGLVVGGADTLSGEITAARVESTDWVTTLRGTRRGGGVALRVLRAD